MLPVTERTWVAQGVDLLLPSRQKRPAWLCLSLAGLVVMVSTAFGGPVTRQLDQAWIGGSIGVYFDVAVNWARCGRYGRIAHWTDAKNNPVSFAHIPDLSVYDKSVPQILQEGLGSASRYCELSSDFPPDLYEPSLMLIEAGTLRLRPNASLRDLARTMAFSRLVMIGFFAWWLLARGFSLLFVATAAGSAVYIVLLLGGNALYSNYPFVLPTALVVVALAERASASNRRIAQTAWYLAFGLGVAFLGNLRTSHYPIGLALFGLTLLFQVRPSRKLTMRSAAAILALSTIPFFVGLATFHYTFIKPLAHSKFVRHYHMVAHPLVLGLANPPNALAEREGIAWDDRAGVLLAKRMDPTVGDDTMGERYEQAMYAYFAKLWIYYPSEMLDIYRQKFIATTEHAYAFLENPRGDLFWPHKNPVWMTWFASTARPVAIRITAGGFAILVIVLGWIAMRRIDYSVGFIVAAIGCLGLLSFLEAAVTLGMVVLWYTPVFVFSLVCFGLVPIELLLTVVRGARRPVLPGGEGAAPLPEPVIA